MGNAAGRAVSVQATVYSNWGIPVLSTRWELCNCGVSTFNLRDWLVLGHLPDRDLTPEGLAHVQAALSGEPSPRDGLYYGTAVEAAAGCAVGYVILRTQDFPRADALWGDFFLVDPDVELAEGEALVNLDPSVDHRPLCRRHALRFLEGGAAEADTKLIVWTARRTLPSPDPYYPETGKVGCEMDCFDEPGNLLDHHAMGMLPMEVMHVGDLALPEPFGWIDVTTELESFITVRHAARGHFDVAIRTWCLPEEREEPPPEEEADIDVEKLTNGHDADSPPGPTIPVGDLVSWTYVVTNTGGVPLANITVTDDQGVGVTCSVTLLDPGESMTCTASGVAVEDQYANLGTATGNPPGAPPVSDSDPSHYYWEEQEPPGEEGCTPGYWKNHAGSWALTGYTTSQSVASIFAQASAYPAIGSATLLAALDFGGGPGVEGAARILLRAGVAALLNAAHPGVSYPRTESGVVADADTALASGDRDTLLLLAAALDAANNLGCPLN